MQNKKVVHTFILLLLLTTTLIGWATYRIALATDESGGSPEAAETQLVDDALDDGKEVKDSEARSP